jgi:rhodanese-related sulfurtransferase
MASIAALLGRTLVLALLGVVSGLIVNMLRPDAVDWRVAIASATCNAVQLSVPVEIVPIDRAAALCASSGVLIADARDAERFSQGHIAGAVHLPCSTPGALLDTVPRLLASVDLVLVYADTTDAARPVAEGLRQRNATAGLRVAVLEGGFEAWARAGQACLSGPCPRCQDAEVGTSHAH